MDYFRKFKTYLVCNQTTQNPTPLNPIRTQLKYEPIQNYPRKQFQIGNINATDTFELILKDLLNQEQQFQDLVWQEEMKDNFSFNANIKSMFNVSASQGRQITIQQWNVMFEKCDISLQPKSNSYFSIFKGIDFTIRKNVWDLLANVKGMKNLYALSYKKIINEELISKQTLIQIQKDVPRTKSITKFLPQLKNILIAYVVLSGKDYIQGMNMIVGCLLQLLYLGNDQQLQTFAIQEEQFQERVFWVFIGIMKWKHWEKIFAPNMTGLMKVLQNLEKLMVKQVGPVYQKLIDFEWDLTIFSQYYLTLMIYNNPKDFCKIILDLFLIDGEDALNSLIIRMMILQKDKIISFKDDAQLMMYFKAGLMKDCLKTIQNQQKTAKKLTDFDMDFSKHIQ